MSANSIEYLFRRPYIIVDIRCTSSRVIRKVLVNAYAWLMHIHPVMKDVLIAWSKNNMVHLLLAVVNIIAAI